MFSFSWPSSGDSKPEDEEDDVAKANVDLILKNVKDGLLKNWVEVMEALVKKDIFMEVCIYTT